VRLFRSPLAVVGAIVGVVGLLIAVLSAVEWQWQRDEDATLRRGGVPITGTVYIVKSVARDGKPAVVRVNYSYQGERQAEVDVGSAPDRSALGPGATLDLLVLPDEPSSPRLVDAVGGGDEATWRNSTFGGAVLAVAGVVLLTLPLLRKRRYGG
jgi:hypothetical protein